VRERGKKRSWVRERGERVRWRDKKAGEGENGVEGMRYRARRRKTRDKGRVYERGTDVVSGIGREREIETE
jgi:hypothetical protein